MGKLDKPEVGKRTSHASSSGVETTLEVDRRDCQYPPHNPSAPRANLNSLEPSIVVTQDTMKPPQKEAVAEALSILMGSVNKENDPQFVFQEIPAAFASLSSLPDNVEALALAKSCINKKLDALISSMQHRRNLVAPIHKLPVEVLVMIFAHFSASSSLMDDCNLLGLSTVNDAIVHSPQLWTLLESDFSFKIAKLVVQRSKSLPLSLIWDTTGCDKSEQPELAEILELAVQNSVRLRSIEMTVWELSEPSVRKLLESNMPHLEKLQVKAVWEADTGEELLDDKFELLDGPPLREISLDRASPSSWSSTRLSGLVALELKNPRPPPSVEELLNVLSNCTQLERLRLRECRRNGGPFDWKRLSDKPITLPHLKDLYAEDIGRPYFTALLVSVYAPFIKSVYINTNFYWSGNNPLEEVCTLGIDQLAALLGLANSGSRSPGTPMPINISVEAFKLQIERYGNNEARKISIRFAEELSARVVDLLGQFLLALLQPPKVELLINVASSWRHGTLDLLPWSRSLHKLSAHGAVVCRAVLKQLAQQTVDPTKGVTIWVCPNLTSIDLCYMHGGNALTEWYGVALETLVRARWSDKGAVEQLSEFTIRCEEEEYPSIWSRETFLKEAIPCLSLVDTE